MKHIFFDQTPPVTMADRKKNRAPRPWQTGSFAFVVGGHATAHPPGPWLLRECPTTAAPAEPRLPESDGLLDHTLQMHDELGERRRAEVEANIARISREWLEEQQAKKKAETEDSLSLLD